MRRGRISSALIVAAVCAGALSAGAISPAAASPSGGWPAALHARLAGFDAQLRASSVAPSGPAAQGLPIPRISVHDPVGDVPSAAGDLTGVGIAQNASGTSFEVTVKSPRNPKTDPTWLAGGGVIFWTLDTNGDGQFDDAAIMASLPDGTLVSAAGGASGPNPKCSPTAVFLPQVGYRVTAPAGCLPRISSARINVQFIYGDPGDPNSPLDSAPDFGFSPSIVIQQGLTDGYWMLGADGHVYPFGGAIAFPGLVPGAQAMAPRKDGKGYWIVDFGGHVFTYGSAHFFGGGPPLNLGEFVSTISATPNGGGYWLFTNQGRVFPFGNASSYGDMSGTVLNGPIVASVATPTGHGYYMVGSDGGIFSFGDARFHGSTGGMHLNKPIVGISPTSNGLGYWLVASDGGVFAFSAPFRGSMGGTRLNQPVDGLVAFGNGYLMAASDGGIFNFSNKGFEGSLAANPPAAPIIGLAAFSL